MRLKQMLASIILAGAVTAPLASWAEGPADESVAAPDTEREQAAPRTSPDPGASDEEQSLGISGTGSGASDDYAAPRSSASARSGGRSSDDSNTSSSTTPLGAADGSQDALERQQRSWSGP